MTRREHLLSILAEECAEVAQRVSKALRFGLQECEPGQHRTNAERIFSEMIDLLAAYHMLADEPGAVPQLRDISEQLVLRRAKVREFLAYSERCGTITQ